MEYNTTWDRWPNLDKLAAAVSSGDQHFALINFAEIDRLERSGIIEPGWSSQGVSEWVRLNTQPIKVWQDLGQVLVKIGKPSDASANPDPAPKP